MSSVFDWCDDEAHLPQIRDKIVGLQLKKEIYESQQRLQTNESALQRFSQEHDRCLRRAASSRESLAGARSRPFLMRLLQGVEEEKRAASDAEIAARGAAGQLQQAQQQVHWETSTLRNLNNDLHNLKQKYRNRRAIVAALRRPWDPTCDQAALDKVIHQEELLSVVQTSRDLVSRHSAASSRMSETERMQRIATSDVTSAKAKDWSLFFGFGPNAQTTAAENVLSRQSNAAHQARMACDRVQDEQRRLAQSRDGSIQSYHMRYEREDYCADCDHAPCECDDYDDYNPCRSCGRDPCECDDYDDYYPCGSCGRDPCECHYYDDYD